MASPQSGDPRRSGYWQGSAFNPYLDIPGDALEDEEPLTRRRPDPIPSPAPPPAAQRRSAAREGRPSATPRTGGARYRQVRTAEGQHDRRQPAAESRTATPHQASASSQGTRIAQGQRPAPRQAPSAGSSPQARPAPQARPVSQAQTTQRPQARRPQTSIATPLPPRPTLRGASNAGTDRLARAEAARRALDTNAYFLDESRQPRKGRANPQAPCRPVIPDYRLHFWRWFRTLPIVVMALFGAASIVVSLGLFGIDRWLYPVEYNETIAQMAETYGVDPMLISAIIRTESGWDPDVVSRMGAVGLMQLLPDTASELAERGVVDTSLYSPTNLLDPETNIAYGTAYLRECLDGTADVDQAIAAYNAGIGAAQDWAQSGTPFAEAIQYPETTAYLERVKQNLDRYTQTYSEGFPTEDEGL